MSVMTACDVTMYVRLVYVCNDSLCRHYVCLYRTHTTGIVTACDVTVYVRLVNVCSGGLCRHYVRPSRVCL